MASARIPLKQCVYLHGPNGDYGRTRSNDISSEGISLDFVYGTKVGEEFLLALKLPIGGDFPIFKARGRVADVRLAGDVYKVRIDFIEIQHDENISLVKFIEQKIRAVRKMRHGG